MQEYLKKITLPQPGGSPQELRVLTPGEVEAMLARSYFAAQDEYWSNTTPEEKERILDAIVAEGLRLDDIWASIKWPSECMKYVDTRTGDLLPYSGEMPKFLPAFDFTGKSKAEIEAYFRYGMNEDGRRNVRVCGGLSGAIPEGIKPELLVSYSYLAPPYQGADYTAVYYEQMLRLLHTGPVDIAYSGVILDQLYRLYNSDDGSRVSGLRIRLVGDAGDSSYHLVEHVSIGWRAVVDASIFIQDGLNAQMSLLFPGASEVNLRIYGSPLTYGLLSSLNLESVSINPEFKPRTLDTVFIKESPYGKPVNVYGHIDCSRLSGGANDLGYCTPPIRGLVLKGLGSERYFSRLNAADIRSWAVDDVLESLRLLYNRPESWTGGGITFNKNLESSIPAELIAEATAKGFTIIFK